MPAVLIPTANTAISTNPAHVTEAEARTVVHRLHAAWLKKRHAELKQRREANLAAQKAEYNQSLMNDRQRRYGSDEIEIEEPHYDSPQPILRREQRVQDGIDALNEAIGLT